MPSSSILVLRNALGHGNRDRQLNEPSRHASVIKIYTRNKLPKLTSSWTTLEGSLGVNWIR